jgi:hypothetical protein
MSSGDKEIDEDIRGFIELAALVGLAARSVYD